MTTAGTKIKQTIDTSVEDRAFVEEFVRQTDMLAKMTVEMVETEKQLLLSPVMRQQLVDKAKEVQKRLDVLKDHLCSDNLHENFKL